ncbi:MAG: 3-oxoacyl-[acyl-carrier-protein] reductase [Holosporales bacterium]|jgi:3-oxoacyl-[acyl-carrier protein] reductase|nr:3-oxoacyl-[acyl-carrier-protein] reductase [Holosporales bacterium]
MESSGRTALITGATGDIGRAITRAFISDGYRKIAISGIEDDVLDQMKKELSSSSCDIFPFKANLANEEEADALFRSAEQSLEKIDVLVNCAGVTRDGLILRMSDADWALVLKLNLEASFRLCRAAVPSMIARRYGRIVNIASVVGCMGNPGQVNYCASKAGLIGMSKALALEIGSRGVTVNCVAPGFIDSAMTNSLNERVKERLLSAIPLGRTGSPTEVANAVAFLASDKAAYITGTTLHVNGGLYLG